MMPDVADSLRGVAVGTVGIGWRGISKQDGAGGEGVGSKGVGVGVGSIVVGKSHVTVVSGDAERAAWQAA